MAGVKAGIAYQEYADPQLFPEAMRDARLKLSEWILTDDDCLQHGRLASLSAPIWEFVQINETPKPNLFCIEHAHIDLRDYSDSEKEEMLFTYGYGVENSHMGETLAAFCRRFGRSSNQLLAEMFFETECAEFQGDQVHGYQYAVGRVEKITGLDLSQEKRPEKNKKPSLDEQILDASAQRAETMSRESVLNKLNDIAERGEGR